MASVVAWQQRGGLSKSVSIITSFQNAAFALIVAFKALSPKMAQYYLQKINYPGPTYKSVKIC